MFIAFSVQARARSSGSISRKMIFHVSIFGTCILGSLTYALVALDLIHIQAPDLRPELRDIADDLIGAHLRDAPPACPGPCPRARGRRLRGRRLRGRRLRGRRLRGRRLRGRAHGTGSRLHGTGRSRLHGTGSRAGRRTVPAPAAKCEERSRHAVETGSPGLAPLAKTAPRTHDRETMRCNATVKHLPTHTLRLHIPNLPPIVKR